jgi:hypothetical protein
MVFSEPIKNTIIENSIFVRIIYSPPEIVFNGIFISLSDGVYAELIQLEKNIISKYKSSKTPRYIFPDIFLFKSKMAGYLKISGIWENKYTVGIAYKIIDHPSVL